MLNNALLKESRILLSEGYKLPENPSRDTLVRWTEDGVVSRSSGARVYLDHIQIGGRTFTSVEAYGRFIAALNGD
jgi:hypothetical protein